MQDNHTIEYVPGARWAISRTVNGRSISLVQDARIMDDDEPFVVLRALGIPATAANIDTYFPFDRVLNRCPTFPLMQLWYEFGRNHEDTPANWSPGV